MERADLAFDFLDQILDAQKILIGVFKLAERFAFLRFELGDAGGFLEDHATVIGFAGKNLRDVALGHDAVARPAHARAHEQLLNVFQPAGGLVDIIFAPAIPENPPRDGDLVIGDFNPGRLEMLSVHATDRQRNLCHAERLATVRPVENDIRHLSTAQRLGRLLAQNPPNRV